MPRLQASPGLLRAQEGELLIGFRSESLLASERPHLFGVRLFRLRTRRRHTGCFRRLMPQPDCPGRMNRLIKTVDGVSAAVFASGSGQDAYSSAVTIPCTANLIGHPSFTLCTAIKLLGKQTVFPRKDFISSFICHREQPTINIQRFSNRIFRYISKNYRLLSKSKQANCTASSRAKINRLFSAS